MLATREPGLQSSTNALLVVTNLSQDLRTDQVRVEGQGVGALWKDVIGAPHPGGVPESQEEGLEGNSRASVRAGCRQTTQQLPQMSHSRERGLH